MLLDIPSELETERLLLRPYIPGDGQWLHTVFQKNASHLEEAIEGVKSGLGSDLTNSTEAEIFVRQLAADWAARKRFIFGVWDKAAGGYVGDIWIESRPLHEIGCFIVEDQLGRGFATEATKAALKFAFEHLKSQKAIVTCHEDNESAYRVAERCGFIREGRLRGEVKRRDGALADTLYYGMLRAEFETLIP